MPVAALTCPHCEKPVEIQVTAVTRSRACPACGQILMLQVAEKESGMKRKALLVAPTSPTDTLQKPDLSQEPQQLPGDAFERMRSDPELQRMRARLIRGVVFVMSLIALAAVLSLMGLWKMEEPEPVKESALIPISDANMQREEHVMLPPAISRPLDIEKSIRRIQMQPSADLTEKRDEAGQ